MEDESKLEGSLKVASGRRRGRLPTSDRTMERLNLIVNPPPMLPQRYLLRRTVKHAGGFM
jgi:hypothetical protein